MSLDEKLKQLLEQFEPIDDPQERMALVIDTYQRRKRLADADKIEANRVHGCISAAYIVGRNTTGKCLFETTADSPLVQGLLACLCDFFSDSEPKEVAASTLDPLKELGLTRNLSPTRQNGLSHARERLRQLAKAME